MESKLEPVKTRTPYQLTLTLNEDDIRGLYQFLGSVTYDWKDKIKGVFDAKFTDEEVVRAWSTQSSVFNICADAVDFLDSEVEAEKADRKKTRS